MISPELVRRYPFFWCIDDAQQKAVAMIAEDVHMAKGTTIFREGEGAAAVYLLLDGSVSLCIATEDKHGKEGKLLFVGEVNPGEPFGISAMLYDETYTSRAVAAADVRAIKIDAEELRKLMTADCGMGFCLMQQVAKASFEILRLTHIQLAAAQS